ncbi:tRNA cyclic N6-threonylcarbamoyladenosine(37) synthase TcdA [Glaciecola petra]|uniref:tRNA cyclic N6-threonylcarbamoyladenosine(37) synthase TcdA n=1 Tax=Glaciecola petra TaxID=3075602 RepID=A0ABU2ZPF0_9ALTE|nr:tRNA cyclic N6-threonylcarbamoyladenosine(37) synthase TcdA [Aestuariibacter sp. P117]MDT0594475.1 tRNA cyclic N6-threonylcarbamoyladenosine(37) synthase TcdA [Aestuariibacter sp. P117]
MTYFEKFAGIKRLYGNAGLMQFKQSHILVVGIGGVGSWIAESLARSGIGELTLIDLDDLAISNINRQIHALDSTLEQSKTEVMQKRILDINHECKVNEIEDFVTPENVKDYIGFQHDVVIDATDSVKAKAALIAHCKRNKIKVISIGGAGGQTDPLQIRRADLAKTIQDPLLAKVRSELRRYYHFSKNTKRNFGVECIYSCEQLKYPTPDGKVSFAKQASEGASKMDCSTGFGAFVGVTATFGMVATSRALSYLINKL